MAFNVTFETGNDAFADDPGAGVAWVLRRLAERIEAKGYDPDHEKIETFDGHTVRTVDTGMRLSVLDVNGATIGVVDWLHA